MSAVSGLSSNSSKNQEEFERMNNDIQEEVIRNIQKELVDQDINFTGDLSGSFKPGMDGIFHTVESDSPYAGFVENGMPSGQYVDFHALRIWVEGKLGIQEGDGLTFITWKIYHKIVGNGIAPKRFMKKAVKKFIGEHGKHNISGAGGNAGTKKKKGGFFTKALKSLKKAGKTFKKINRKINNAVKPIKKGYKRETKGYTR